MKIFKKPFFLFSFLLISLNSMVFAKNDNFYKTKDFEGTWSFFGGAQGGLSGNTGLAISQFGILVLDKKGNGKLLSNVRASWSGGLGTPINNAEQPAPSTVTLELTRPELGEGVLTILSNPSILGPTVDLKFAIIVIRGNQKKKVQKFYAHLTEVIPVISGKVPNCLPVLTFERQFDD